MTVIGDLLRTIDNHLYNFYGKLLDKLYSLKRNVPQGIPCGTFKEERK